ncbi:cytochrome P450 [Actinosynnema sp. NPDC047251]|uniref:Cytochrome P450 family protein n=1 Tax=Saccharothrix espanaensis (strain ATCC 51144 / DSM 44229 / JCM 9112 / NBRC 15066 / NRRL 15764) TaxID=1179773 RepID=K0K0Z3_SACES|nr:cytochrome P450 [Saccharothrix espanaensis]CCH31212.1 Cytochrome P450 family protein [Saccharothrix espanaensis DSM 44229]
MTRSATYLRRTPPGPPRSATFGLLKQLAGDRLTLMTSAAREYGDAVRMAIGPKTLYFFNNPEHAKHVLADNAANYHKGIGLVHARRAIGDGLLTSEGELWRKQRRATQPAFQHKRIARQAGAVAESAGRLVDRLRAGIGGPPVNLTEEVTGLTLDVLGRTLLSEDLSRFEHIGHSFEAVQDQAMFEMVTMSAVPMWVPLPHQLRFRKARRELRRVVAELAARRVEHGGHDGDDVLSRVLASVAEERDEAVGDRRLHDELVTLMLAGHETTASTLGWAFHLLDRHPEVKERVRAEARAVLGDRTPVYEDLRALRYTAMVVDEVVRLFPPVWILPRAAQADDHVGDWFVPAGADVLICPYTLHRHPGFWDRPDRFDPDRFDPAAATGRPRYAYLPFGAGPRFCVGNHLGIMEAVFTLAMITRELDLRSVPGRDVVPEPMLSLRIRGGLRVTAHPVG